MLWIRTTDVVVVRIRLNTGLYIYPFSRPTWDIYILIMLLEDVLLLGAVGWNIQL